MTYEGFEPVYKRKLIDLLTDKRILCDYENLNIVFTESVNLIFKSHLENLPDQNHSENAIFPQNSQDETNYHKEYEEILQFGRENHQNIEPMDAQNIISLLEKFADLLIAEFIKT